METTPPVAPPNPPAEPAQFATAVTAARTQRQMSRQALAEQAGISLKTLEDVERGYPVSREIEAALCRNLGLPEPSLDTNPLVRFALRLRERRGLARLSRAQLAHKVGVSTPMIRALETATMRPSQEVCIGLLGVKALGLQESDLAAFLRPAEPGAEGEVTPNGHPSAGDTASPRRLPHVAGAMEGAGSRPARARRAGSASMKRADGNRVVLSVRVRVFANGKVSIEMRPPAPKRHQGTSSK